MSDADHPKRKVADASLWAFAVDLYAAPGVPESCLTLQDRHGCDVNVLLFAAWLGAVRKRVLTTAEMSEAACAVQDWHAEIVRPLRGVRRRMKSGPSPAPSETSETLRTYIKSIEIEAERLELAALERLAATWHAETGAQRDGDTLANLTTAIRYFAGGEPAPEARELIRTIENGLTHMSPVASS
jgi:uncharacterized protein (TIGR02444 family)